MGPQLDDIFRTGYQPLKYNVAEIDGSADYFEKKEKFVRHHATEAKFKTFADQGKILHLAMHAFTHDEDPMLSHLVFAPSTSDSEEDGILYGYELYNMQLNAHTAVLSACNTGMGKVLDGQGVMSLARAFRYAGVQNVVMSLWPAHDAATRDMMTTFFQHLQANGNEVDALRVAMSNHFSKEHEEWHHPYYWAGFSLIGGAKATAHVGGQFAWITIILLMALTIILWYFVGRR